jgi:glycerophosphoryl diester phosphodiesterase
VHAWTVRPENEFLPPALRTGDDPKGRGCGDVQLARMLEAAGVAGVFSDGPLKFRDCPAN